MAGKMKDSGVEWIGEIPEEWTVEPLWSIANIEGKSQEYKESYPYLALENIESWTGKIGNLGSQDIVESNVTLFNSDCVLFGKLRPYLAKVVRPSFKGMATTELLCFVPGDKTDRDYLFWCFANKAFIDSINAQTYGVKMPRTSWSQMRSMHMPRPLKEEQEAIAAHIDAACSRIDAAISTIEKEIDVLERHKTSLIYETVTKGLNPDVPMKDSGIEWIGEIPEGWSTPRFKYAASMSGRIGYRGYTTQDIVDEGDGALSISPSNLGEYGLDFDKTTYISWEKYNESPEIKVQNEDVIFTKTGSSYGKSSFVENLQSPATINPQVVIMRAKEGDYKYLYYLTKSKSFNDQVNAGVVGGTIPTIAQGTIESFSIPWPPMEEQRRIAAFLDSVLGRIKTIIQTKLQLLSLLKRQRQSLIYEYVTGKKRVPGYGEEA